MNALQKALVTEHVELIQKIAYTEAYLNTKSACGIEGAEITKEEFATINIQLEGMYMYERALGQRLYNAGIVYDGNRYLETFATNSSVLLDECKQKTTFEPVENADEVKEETDE